MSEIIIYQNEDNQAQIEIGFEAGLDEASTFAKKQQFRNSEWFKTKARLKRLKLSQILRQLQLDGIKITISTLNKNDFLQRI